MLKDDKENVRGGDRNLQSHTSLQWGENGRKRLHDTRKHLGFREGRDCMNQKWCCDNRSKAKCWGNYLEAFWGEWRGIKEREAVQRSATPRGGRRRKHTQQQQQRQQQEQRRLSLSPGLLSKLPPLPHIFVQCTFRTQILQSLEHETWRSLELRNR